MTPTEYRAIRKKLGLTQAGLAALLGETREIISRRETGAAPIEPRSEWAILGILYAQKTSVEEPREEGLDDATCSLFHVTTGRKAKLYRQTGMIKAPVRGFDTLLGAMAWAMKVGRKVILRVDPATRPQMLPDHHNAFGQAWWTDDVPMSRAKCIYSAEGSWPEPDADYSTNDKSHTIKCIKYRDCTKPKT